MRLLKPLLFPQIISPIKLKMNGPSNTIILHKLGDSDSGEMGKKGAELIQSGGLIGVPTDTIYGIAADAQNPKAISRMYQVKGREFSKPIAICVGRIKQVYEWGKVSVPESMLEELLPGPVTLVFERQPTLNPDLNPGTHLIGIRIPKHKFIQDLANSYGLPIALTSANPSSAQSTLSPEEFKCLWPSLDAVFDGGRIVSSPNPSRAGSTVIDLSESGSFRIIREGSAHESCIQILKKYNLFEKKLD